MTLPILPNPAPADRVIRVFVSSTFRDMQAERDELIKQVFPKLRKLCDQRGVSFVDVDLRWGITEEEAAKGEVLPICLAEIERCRPFFIGLLGERYGWVPQKIQEELIESHPWLAEHLHKSVTELEILHGVFNKYDMANRAFFYFRSPLTIEKIPPSKRDAFIESDPDRKVKLELLKHRILQSGLRCYVDYPDTETLGHWVYEHLAAAINQIYPPVDTPDHLMRETAEHEIFARSRTAVYIGRQEDFKILDDHAIADGPPLVVLGESGSGKSALLANWALRHRLDHPGTLVLMHFVGASQTSTDLCSMLRRILGELQKRFQLEGEIPDDSEHLQKTFVNWLSMAAARGRVVLVLDALNQLEDWEGTKDLVWLPHTFPSTFKLIVSSLPGQSLQELTRRNWPTLTVKLLNVEERTDLIQAYLSPYTKKLSADRIERISRALPSGNPLYLRALLDELRVFGTHERLDERISHYLSTQTVSELYEKILQRWEEDFERNRPGLVRDAMMVLWAARRGLTELEVVELLGMDGQPIPHAQWSPLFLAAESGLIVRWGLITFSHTYLRNAVEHRYLPDDLSKQLAHRRLADYFDQEDVTVRQVDELPWQLCALNDWKGLAEQLADPVFLEVAWQTNRYDVRSYWARIEINSDFRLLEAYDPILMAPEKYESCLDPLFQLFLTQFHLAEALKISQAEVRFFTRQGKLKETARCLSKQALIYFQLGNTAKSMKSSRRAAAISRKLEDEVGLYYCLGNEAAICHSQGDLDHAMSLYEEQVKICQRLNLLGGLQGTLRRQALVFAARGNFQRADEMLHDVEIICRSIGDQDALANCLNNQGVMLIERGSLNAGLLRLEEAEAVCRASGDTGTLISCLNNQALAWVRQGNSEAALRVYRETEQIARAKNAKPLLQMALFNQANVLKYYGELDAALELIDECETICRELKADALAGCIGTRATIMALFGQREDALRLHREEESIYRQMGDKDGIAISLCNQAVLMQEGGNLNAAMRYHEEEEHLCRDIENMEGVSVSLTNQGRLLRKQGKTAEALVRMTEAVYIARQLGLKNLLGNALSNLADVHADRGEIATALKLVNEAEIISRELSFPEQLQGSLGTKAMILQSDNRLDEALRALREQESICRKLRIADSLQESLGAQAEILRIQGFNTFAMELFREQEAICRKKDLPAGLAWCLANQGLTIATERGKTTDALSLAENGLHLAQKYNLIYLISRIERLVSRLNQF